MFILAGNCTNFRFKKMKNALPNMMDFGENYFNNDVLEKPMYDVVDRDGPLDDNLNEPIYMNHDCTCKIQINPRHYLVC